MHLKRQKVPKNWPIPRKGTKYVVVTKGNLKQSVPVLVFLRDILKIAQNKKEVKKALYEGNILINSKKAKDVKQPVFFLDSVSVLPSKKHYKLGISKNGKFEAQEIKEQDSKNKITKVASKKKIKGNKTQVNFFDGKNIISDFKINTGDSAIVNFEKKEIEKGILLKDLRRHGRRLG